MTRRQDSSGILVFCTRKTGISLPVQKSETGMMPVISPPKCCEARCLAAEAETVQRQSIVLRIAQLARKPLPMISVEAVMTMNACGSQLWT